MHTLLIGLFSAGKTSVGEMLAAQLALPFYDVDRELEKEVGCSCGAYYKEVGEERFRQKESELFSEMLYRPPGILAPGGGIVLGPSKDLLKKCPKRLYLYYSLQEVLTTFSQRRIPAFVTDLESEYFKREPCYQELATNSLVCDGLKIEDIVSQLIDIL